VSSYYVDTSVIIARYKPNDELYRYSSRIFELKNVSFYISPITLLELFSVLSRIKDSLTVPFKEKPLIASLVTFIVKDCRLKVASKAYTIKKRIAGSELRTPIEYYLAMKYAESLRLRTLDMLHVVYAWLFKRLYDVRGLVTGDEEIIRRSEAINECFGIEILHPREVR